MTPEQQARDLLDRMDCGIINDSDRECDIVVTHPRNMSAGEGLREACELYPRAWTDAAARSGDYERITALRALAEGKL